MRKWFILSVRTLTSKRDVTLSFGDDNTIIIPMAVLDELQSDYVSRYDERGKTAKELLDYLWSFDRKKLFQEGVKQKNGSVLRITTNFDQIKIPEIVEKTKLTGVEKRILQTCLGIQKEVKDSKSVVLVSKSTLLRMKAELLGINAQTFKDELLPEISEQYSGRATINVSQEMLDEFFKYGKIPIEKVKPFNDFQEFYPNMFIIMKTETGSSGLGRVNNNDNIVKLVYHNCKPYGVRSQNVGQTFMIESLMTDCNTAPLVIFKGPSGTAKTFMSLATGLEQILAGKYQNKMLISRSPTETGEKLGYLPGGEADKISPYLRGIMDNLKRLHTPENSEEKEVIKKATSKKFSNGKKTGAEEYEEDKPEYEDGSELFSRGWIKVEAVGFIRGRSICDTFIIIDEAQNFTPTEIKTIITRVGKGTKLVIIGDPEQIDRPELTERNNGISYASERLKKETICWQITMNEEESVRSELARIASKLL